MRDTRARRRVRTMAAGTSADGSRRQHGAQPECARKQSICLFVWVPRPTAPTRVTSLRGDTVLSQAPFSGSPPRPLRHAKFCPSTRCSHGKARRGVPRAECCCRCGRARGILHASAPDAPRSDRRLHDESGGGRRSRSAAIHMAVAHRTFKWPPAGGCQSWLSICERIRAMTQVVMSYIYCLDSVHHFGGTLDLS